MNKNKNKTNLKQASKYKEFILDYNSDNFSNKSLTSKTITPRINTKELQSTQAQSTTIMNLSHISHSSVISNNTDRVNQNSINKYEQQDSLIEDNIFKNECEELKKQLIQDEDQDLNKFEQDTVDNLNLDIKLNSINDQDNNKLNNIDIQDSIIELNTIDNKDSTNYISNRTSEKEITYLKSILNIQEDNIKNSNIKIKELNCQLNAFKSQIEHLKSINEQLKYENCKLTNESSYYRQKYNIRSFNSNHDNLIDNHNLIQSLKMKIDSQNDQLKKYEKHIKTPIKNNTINLDMSISNAKIKNLSQSQINQLLVNDIVHFNFNFMKNMMQSQSKLDSIEINLDKQIESLNKANSKVKDKLVNKMYKEKVELYGLISKYKINIQKSLNKFKSSL